MAQSDILEGLSVDGILADVKARESGKDMKVWSMAEIDALLDTDDPAPPKRKQNTEKAAPAAEKAAQKPPAQKAEPKSTAPKQADTPAPAAPEKTRLFPEKEVESLREAVLRKTYGENIPTGAFKETAHGMEQDANRTRFLNRPERMLEKTQEHRELLSKLPPKTIEKPGVIVKNQAEKTQVIDGLQSIPTLVTPEDALRAERVQDGALHHLSTEENSALENQMILDGFDVNPPAVEIVDEEKAEQDLYIRRQKKAQKFRLFPGLEMQDDEASDEYEDADEAYTDEYEDTYGDEFAYAQEDEADDGEGDYDRAADLARRKALKQEKKEAKRQAKHQPKAEIPTRVLREYYGPKDKSAVAEIYKTDKRRTKIRLVLAAVLTAAATLSALLVRLTGQFTWVGGTAAVYSAVNLVFLLLLAGTAAPVFSAAFKALKYNRLTAELGLVLALLCSLIQVGASFAYGEELRYVSLYTPVAALLFTLYYAARCNKIKADLRNFAFVSAAPKDFFSLCRLEDSETAFEIGRGLLLEDPDVRYSKKIAFPQSFVEVSQAQNPAQDIFEAVIPIALLAGAIIGGVSAYLFHSAFMGLSAMTVTVLAGLPAAALLGSNAVLSGVNRRMEKEGIFIASYAAANDALGTNAVVLDAADLFNTSACRLSGMKLYHKMRVDEALLYTAAMVIQSGGTLAEVFDGVILQKKEILPEVDSLNYEERLGCSGWIYNQRVLVGSRDLLQKHNVAVPSVQEEKRFKKADSEILYLAVEGKLAALFVVTYASNAQTGAALQRLERYGVNLLVRTSDPNITEALIEQTFSLPNNLVKIIHPVAGDMFRDLMQAEPKKAPCGLLHRGKPNLGLRTLLAAFVTAEKYKLTEILLYIGSGIAISLMAILSFFSGLTQAGAAEIVFFQLLWTFIVTQIPKLKKM